MHSVQHWSNLAEIACEDAAGQPGAARFLGFAPEAQGLKLSTGTILDATMIGALSSNKNAGRQHGPEKRQTKDGQQSSSGSSA